MLFAFAVVGCVLIVYTRATVPTVRRQFYRDKAPIDSSTPKSIPTPNTIPDLAPMSIPYSMPTQAVHALALVIQRTAEFSTQLEYNGSNDATVANQLGPSGEAPMNPERDNPFANDPIQTSTTTALTVACTSEFFTQHECGDGEDASMVGSVVLEVEASINTEGYVMATDSLAATPSSPLTGADPRCFARTNPNRFTGANPSLFTSANFSRFAGDNSSCFASANSSSAFDLDPDPN
ncbi:hypothetical protein LPJ73_004720 [Coemansia sp. RSA 2703]|nr:hypothetical protein LPJ73_004720 [Coemansia sp. RSA 2703]